MNTIWKILIASIVGGIISTALSVFPSPIFLLFFFSSVIVGTVTAVLLYHRLDKSPSRSRILPFISIGILTGILTCLLTNGILYTIDGQDFYTNLFYYFFYPIRPYGDTTNNLFALKATFIFELMTFVETGVFSSLMIWGILQIKRTERKQG